jgi:hypothetical protein
MATNAGVTPWTLLVRGNQMMSRLFRGGAGTRVTRVGPKEARAVVAGIPLMEIPYFRHALRGIYHGAVSLFCAQVYVSEVTREATPTATTLKVSWA